MCTFTKLYLRYLTFPKKLGLSIVTLIINNRSRQKLMRSTFSDIYL